MQALCWPAALLLAAAAMSAMAQAPAPAATPGCHPPGSCTLVAAAGSLLLRHSTGATLARWPLHDAAGRPADLLAAIELPRRRSFVVMLRGLRELWEISTDPAAEPIYDGLVHDWRMGEGIARPGHLGQRRIALARPWVAVFSDARVPWLVGAEVGDDGLATAVVLHLDIRREVARLPLGALQAAPLQGAALLTGPDGATGPLVLPAPGGGWQEVDPRRWSRTRHRAPPPGGQPAASTPRDQP